MEYLIELISWLPSVKINIGKGINLNLMQILLFPLVCQMLKMLLGVITNRIESGFGRFSTVTEEKDNEGSDMDRLEAYHLESEQKGSFATVGKRTYYIPKTGGYDND